MADNDPGTNTNDDDGDEGASGWFLEEAACSDKDSDFEHLFDESDESDVSDLVDNATVMQGNSRQLFQQQEAESDSLVVEKLKRKYLHSPNAKEVAELSPQLKNVHITPRKAKKSKKTLFATGSIENEAESTTSPLQVEEQVENEVGSTEVLDSGVGLSCTRNPESPEATENIETAALATSRVSKTKTIASADTTELTGRDAVHVLMKSSNHRALIIHKCKVAYGISFNELVRTFKSNKTMSFDWTILVYGVSEETLNGGKQVIINQCEFLYAESFLCIVLALCKFKSQKCRDTVHNLLKVAWGINDLQVICDPPRTASTAVSLFWFQRSSKYSENCFGTLPDWVLTQTSLNHRLAAERPFELSQMIQFAYDQNIQDESDLALQYALLADSDYNAKAFLKANSQSKIIKDAINMVRLYRRAQMRQMTISEWIFQRCKEVPGDREEGWRVIAQFLRFQGIEYIWFISCMTRFLRGVPKKSCMLFWGPPNTGKSMFAMSLLRFMGGKTLTFANHTSHFWLQPLIDAKIGLIDDVTMLCWKYFDQYLRGGLDGNEVCLDAKHKTPVQTKFPPMLLTSNTDLKAEDSLKYLHSRVTCFNFKEQMPVHLGQTKYVFDDLCWKSFFKRFWKHLQLSDQEDDDDEPAQQPLRLDPRKDPKSL